MQVITEGQVRYRTGLLAEDRARRFAACLRGNRRFHSVEVKESPRATNWYRRHFVLFVGANEERQRELRAEQQAARQARADSQPFLFVRDPDSLQPFCWCHSLASGETYETTVFDCSCPDFRHRLRGTGIRCKHMLALSRAEERGDVDNFPAAIGTVPAPPLPALTPERRSLVRARMAVDFPDDGF